MSEEKECRKCFVFKPKTEFYRDKRKSDGLYVYCKKCHEDTYHKGNKELLKKRRATSKAYNLRYPGKFRARKKAQLALKKGLIKKVECKICGSKECLQMHHTDYRKPTDVIILCRPCHMKQHYSTT